RRHPALTARGRATRNALGRTTINDPERTTPNGPGPAKRAIPAARTAEPALAWRYPTPTPAAVRIVSPPVPGRARAASAASEMGSTTVASKIISPATPDGAAGPDSDPVPVSGSSLEAGQKNGCASPGSDDASPTWVIAADMDAAIPPSGATPVAMSATGTPGIPANAQRSGNSDATHACTDADSAALSIRPHASTTGSTPVVPNKKKASSDCSWVSGTTAAATQVSMSWKDPMTAETSVTRLGTGATPAMPDKKE